MPELHISDMQQGYLDLVQYVIDNGRPRSPRGMPTLNVRGMTLVLDNPERALTENIGRRASTRLAALEALQLVAGASWPDLMINVAPNTRQFLNDDGVFHGAYGPRLRDAMPRVIHKIISDTDTRQAVANIFDASRDLDDGIVDVPCNDMVMYEVENGKLNAWTVVRSNDVWWGVAHDVFMFTILQRTLAAHLQLGVGEYRHTAYSMHLYERTFPELGRLHAPTKEATVAPAITVPLGSTWRDVQDEASSIARWGHSTFTADESWWTEVALTWLDGTGTSTG